MIEFNKKIEIVWTNIQKYFQKANFSKDIPELNEKLNNLKTNKKYAIYLLK